MASPETVGDSQPTADQAGSPGDDSPLLAIVLGTRPEIVKLAPIVAECRARNQPFVLIHTGQHYSETLDGVFFETLGLPLPDYNLEVGSGSQGRQTGTMLTRIERVLSETDPDVVLVQGDTNSTLAGALAASKLNIPVGHVEAGLRSFDPEMPEEINRRLTDHLSEFLFAPTTHSAANLRREGLDPGQITVTGNTVVDALTEYRDLAAAKSSILADLGLGDEEYALLTLHRAENVDDPERFASILDGVDRYATSAGMEIIYPIHPRSAERLEEFGLDVPPTIHTVDPVDYLDFLHLEARAAVVFTDSGGVQEETCILGTPCVTLRYSTERPESVFVGANVLAGTQPEDILEAGHRMRAKDGRWSNPFGDGTAAAQILDELAGLLTASATEQLEEDLVS